MLPYFSFTSIALGPLTLEVWGLCVALGFLAALKLSLLLARRQRFPSELVWDVMLLALLGMVVGGRIFFLLGHPGLVSAWIDPHAGFSLLGGMGLAGILAFLYLRRQNQSLGNAADLFTPGFVVSLLFTRIGCLFIGDHVGRITTLPWGQEFSDGSLRQPVTLYEILFLSLALLFICFICLRRHMSRPAGLLFLSFASGYALFRLLDDCLRCSDLPSCDPRLYGLTATQWAVLFLLPLGATAAGRLSGHKR